MPSRHSPPLTDDAEAGKSKKETPRHGAAEEALSSPPHLPPVESKTQAPQLSPPSTQAGPSPETLSTLAAIPLPDITTATSVPSSYLEAHVPQDGNATTQQKTGIITVGGIDFHHESEAEFARLLTYYGIEWEYEPNQFPLQWREGRPIEMFRPDFYLTEYDLYIELTTMRQALVRRKNRKLRLLRALYPEINIKLLYRRDYQRLLERFGIRSEEVEAEWPGREPLRASINDDADEPEDMQALLG